MTLDQRDILFFLPPGFEDNGRREYCPECAELWGLLSWFPSVRESLTVKYIPIARPRQIMVDMLGEDHQNGPTLVLSSTSPHFDNCGIQTYEGYSLIDNARDIGRYYAERFGVPWPRGH